MAELIEITVQVPHEFVIVIDQILEAAQAIEELEKLDRLEELADQKNQEINQAIMQAAFSLKARQEVAKDIQSVKCLKCGGWADLLEADAKRGAKTVAGPVEFRRPVHRCDDRCCQCRRSLFDEQVGLAKRKQYTPLLKRKLAWVGATLTSYAMAAKTLKELCGLEVEPKQIQRVTEESAQTARRLQDREIERLGRPATISEPTSLEAEPETCVIEMDGTCVMGRDGEGHEVKCATVFGLEDRVVGDAENPRRPELLRRAYASTSHGIKAFGALVWAMALSWGVRQARRVVVIGDGAEWIWKYTKDRFYFTGPDGRVFEPIEILDYYHACENLGKARDLVFAQGQSVAAVKWYNRWKDRVRQGGVDELIAELRRREKRCESSERAEALRVRRAYFETHRARMDYPRYESLKLPIGSGAIEGTCKNLIKGRMSCVGQRWESAEGIENMAALRTRIFNEKFEDLWNLEKAA